MLVLARTNAPEIEARSASHGTAASPNEPIAPTESRPQALTDQRRRGNWAAMTPEHLSALLQVAAVTTDAEGWQHPADGRSLTLHLAHDGATLAVSRICAVRCDDKLVFAKSNQGEQYVVSLEDLYAGSVEGPRELGRKAGFA